MTFFNKIIIDKTKTTFPLRANFKHIFHHNKCKLYYSSKTNINNALVKFVNDFDEKGYAILRTKNIVKSLESLHSKILKKEQQGKNPFDNENTLKPNGLIDYPEVNDIFFGDLKIILENILKAHFNYDVATFSEKKSSGDENTVKIWHSDGGPSTHINVFAYFTEASKNTGATTLIEWNDTKKIIFHKANFHKNNKTLIKSEQRVLWDKEVIKLIKHYKIKPFVPNVPPYSIVIFNNSLLHRAELVKKGFVRRVLRARISPSNIEANVLKYKDKGFETSIGCWPTS